MKTKLGQRGFISASIVIAIVITMTVTAGAGYGVYKYSEVKKENKFLSSELENNLITDEAEQEFESEDEVSLENLEDELETEESNQKQEKKQMEVKPSLVSTPQEVTQTLTINTEPISQITENSDPTGIDGVTLRCILASHTGSDIGSDDRVETELKIWEGNTTAQKKDYEIEWSITEGRIVDGQNQKDAVFEFYGLGNQSITADVTRKSDGSKESSSCEVHVFCDEFECLSDLNKQRVILNEIIDTIDSWYDSGDVILYCEFGESVIRALEYDYTVNGGTNLPDSFNKDVDCDTSVAPAAYSYKIELLLNSL